MGTQSVSTQVNREKLVNDVKEVLHDAQVLLQASAGDLSDKAKEAREQLAKKLTEVRGQLSEYKDIAKEKVIEGAKKTDETIRSHPYESIAIAFGFGLLIGIVANRRK